MRERERIPTEKELKMLPRWAIVAFAARCARRDAPLFIRWVGAEAEHIENIWKAIRVAENAAAATEVDAHAAYLAAAAATKAYPVNAASAAAEAAANAASAAAEAAARTAHAAYLAAHPTAWPADDYAMAAAIQHDFRHLQEAAATENWNDDTPVPPEFFGPLWPDGVPEGWPQETEPSEEADIPTKEELKTLPRWAAVAFAARCARRVAPLFTEWRGAGALRGGAEAVHKAIEVAENSARNAHSADDAVEAADDARPAARAAKAAGDAYAAYATDAALAANADKAAAAANAAAEAAEAAAYTAAATKTVANAANAAAYATNTVARSVAKGIAHVKATFNDTIITITDPTGNLLCQDSAGTIGFKGSRKSTPFPAQRAAEACAQKATKMGMHEVEYAAAHTDAYADDRAAAHAATQIAAAMRHDFEKLKRTAREENWNDNTPVPPEFFGPLWPDGVPDGWAVEETCEGHALLFEIEIPDDATDDAVEALVLELVEHADGLHRAMRGQGLKIDDLTIFGDVPAREEVLS